MLFRSHVITTVLEHNSVLRPLYEMERKGVELTILSCDEKGRVDVRDFAGSIRRNTRAIFCTHASNLTGNIIDIQAVGRLRRLMESYLAWTPPRLRE